MKIKDFMITDVITVTKDTSITHLLETLVSNNIGGVPIVEEDNTLLGIISDGDIIRYLHPKSRTVYDMFSLVMVSEKENFRHKLEYSMEHQVDKFMRNKGLQTVQPEDDIEKALHILSKYHFKKLPVVDDDYKVVGVISRGDMIRFISTQLIKIAEEK
ncbi:MAG TPA: CBS domain-containing protein [Bacillota bacterium]|nr:CBS domain-containing protein [Bacillota bacterium]